MTLSEQQLAEIEARANAATVAPWWNESGVIHSTGPRVHPLAHGPYFESEWEQVLADAEFAAEARQDVPTLISEVRLLQALVREYAGLIESDYPLSGHYGEQYRLAKAALGEASL